MASLKEIKARISSVKSTQKITSAMKMVSSAKLRKAQKQIENFYPYQQKLTQILTNFLSAEENIASSVYTRSKTVNRVALAIFSSNSSLCGSFNSNITKKLASAVAQYHHLGRENILIFPIGKKVMQATKKMGFSVVDNFDEMVDTPTYQSAQTVASRLMNMFAQQEVDRVELIYHRFKSKSSQILQQETLLPISLSTEYNATLLTKESVRRNYIVEPDKESLINELIPQVIRLKFYTALLDSIASEHAARTIAMQVATDNADDLLQELNLQFNKSRQQAITSELLDIIGGSFE